MAYRECPDLMLPPSDIRCEAMTKPLGKTETYQLWRRESHRCVRRAVQGRSGRSVCALHGKMDQVNYWNGEPDSFSETVHHQRRRERQEA